jgi:16S rRNA processing protein RimM
MLKRVAVGKIAGAFGIRGWVKVDSYTEPRENILSYSPWLIGPEDAAAEYSVVVGRPHGTGVVAQLAGIESRDQAEDLKSRQIAVNRSQFPSLEPGKYYWTDLVGLEVYNLSGQKLGRIGDVMETGANDVLIVQGERDRLLPFVLGQYVKEVNLEEGRMLVDWDADF